MRLLDVALTGLLGFAGLAAGANDGKNYMPQLNNEDFTYHCEALDITKCNVLGSCSLYEQCAHWCVDLTAPGGAVCADEPPVSIEAREVQATCENDDTSKCICNGLNIQRCDIEGAACSWVEYCANGCFYTDHGTVCVDRREISTRDEDNSAGIQLAQSKCDGVTGNCRECTPTRRGVFACDYGFCAVRPEDWCKKGWSCRDDCDCCKKDRKRGARAVEPRESIAEIKLNPEKALEALEAQGDCVPGQYWCHPLNYAWLLVCDASGKWQIASYCGMVGAYGCCRGTPEPGVDHRCDCRPKRDLKEAKTIEHMDAMPAKRFDAKPAPLKEIIKRQTGHGEESPVCTPGRFWCNDTEEWVVACDPEVGWKKVLYCGKVGVQGCCTISGPTPHCECPSKGGLPEARTIEHDETQSDVMATAPKDAEDLQLEPARSNGQCQPGQFSCDYTAQWIQTCEADGEWKKSLYCGTNGFKGCCSVYGPVGPECNCHTQTEVPLAESTIDDTVSSEQKQSDLPTGIIPPGDKRSDLEPSKGIDPTIGEGPCKPGQLFCSIYQVWVIVCDSNGKWQPHTNCGFSDRRNSYGCCRNSPSGPSCDCRGLPGGPPLPKGEGEHVAIARSHSITIRDVGQLVDVAEGSENCVPGQFWCSPDFRWIIVCNGSGRWQTSAWCGATSQNFGCCRGGSVPGPVPRCDCSTLPGGPPSLQA